MNNDKDLRDHANEARKNTGQPTEKVRQQQTDPNITELKGFVDPNERLEPKADKIDREKKNR